MSDETPWPQRPVRTSSHKPPAPRATVDTWLAKIRAELAPVSTAPRPLKPRERVPGEDG